MVDSILSSLGGGSGIDTQALVKSLVEAERAPREFTLDSKTKTLETQISGYGALRNAMAGIQDSMELLADADTFDARNVAFGDTTLVTPTSVDAGAATGEYEMHVSSLASAHSLSVGGFADADAVVGNGTLSFSFGDWDAGFTALDTSNASKAAKTLTIDDSNNTLNGIKDAINAADFGVQASIIDVGDGTYTLQIASESGASNEMKIAVAEETPAGLAAKLQFDETTQSMAQKNEGQDASFTINGLAVTRSSNTIDDVIDGLEFTLSGVSEDLNDTMTIGIEADKTFGEQIVRDFVEAYNLFLEQTGNLTTPADVDEDAEDQSLGALSRDPTTKTMVNQVRSMISDTLTGLSGNYTALATIGIQTQISGDLEIKEDLFQEALDNHYSSLTDIFTGATSTSDARLGIVKTTAATASGTFDVVVTTDPAKGYAAGGSISATDAADLALTTATGVFAGGLDTSAGDYSFEIKVDGTSSSLITLTGNYADTDALIADMQAQINGDESLSGVAAAVDISYDSTTGSYTTTSRTYGKTSTLEFSNISNDMDRLAFGGGVTAAALTGGTITEPMNETSGVLAGGVIDESGVADLGGTQGDLTLGAYTGLSTPTFTGDEAFEITVDGVDSGAITLTAGAYASEDALRLDMQAKLDAGPLGSGAVTVAWDGTQFSFTSNSAGSASTVTLKTQSGTNIAQLGLAGAVATAGIDNESFANPLDTSVGNYSMTVSVDGADVAIDLSGTGSYADTEAFRSALGTAITGATVSYDSGSNSYSVTSDTTGLTSTVEVTAVGSEMAALGFSVATGTDGKIDQFTTPLDTSVGAYSLSIDVDGAGATVIDLNALNAGAPYNSAEEVRAALDTAIAGVTVGYDATTDTFSFTSDSTGSTSSVVISAVGADIGTKLGITADSDSGRDALAATAGVDVVGTINGVAAFGSGNIMLPELGSELSGLSLEVAPGVTSATFTIARGFGNEINNILDSFLESSGLIASRETSLNTQLDDISTDRETLDRQMDARFSLLQNQFLAMEAIIRSLNGVSGQLDGLVDRLPFTAQKS
ncbi:MAG: flagellar filament capping protein FliD [Motiliproteus sp.]